MELVVLVIAIIPKGENVMPRHKEICGRNSGLSCDLEDCDCYCHDQDYDELYAPKGYGKI